ncbi:MAG TPA: glycosyltransferase family 39 protein, partial [Tepidisphaeraceae bacterium]
MTDARRRVVLAGLMAVAALIFLLGINWGLPSSRVRSYLYGSEFPWSGETLYLLAGGWDGGGSGLGADVDRTPLAQRTEPVLLNGSNRERAEIIRRYLLYSYQPDEMITFRALAAMGSSWDPKLYQYGGLWIYPAGAFVRVGMALHLIAKPPGETNALVYYLENPDAFARFYVAARLYSALWGIAGVWAVWWLARRLTGDPLIAGAAALAYVFLPVVINGAHEAKPHLPGVVLMLMAIVAAVKYVEEAQPKREWLWALLAGALCGAALGMVISSLLIFTILPVMIWRRTRDAIAQRLIVLLAAIGVGVAVYVVTNPYVLINALNSTSPGGLALRSNLKNSTNMYQLSPRGLKDAAVLIGLGASPLIAILGIAGAVAVVVLARKKRDRFSDEAAPAEGASSRLASPSHGVDTAWVLLTPAALILIQFILLAAGKPPEYARFGMLPDIALLLLAAWAGSMLVGRDPMFKQLLAALLVIGALPYGLAYSRAFVRDSGFNATTSRFQAADELPVTGRILLTAEPGPYNTPPVNLFSRDLVLLPQGTDQVLVPGDLLVYPVDS